MANKMQCDADSIGQSDQRHHSTFQVGVLGILFLFFKQHFEQQTAARPKAATQ